MSNPIYYPTVTCACPNPQVYLYSSEDYLSQYSLHCHTCHRHQMMNYSSPAEAIAVWEDKYTPTIKGDGMPLEYESEFQQCVCDSPKIRSVAISNCDSVDNFLGHTYLYKCVNCGKTTYEFPTLHEALSAWRSFVYEYLKIQVKQLEHKLTDKEIIKESFDSWEVAPLDFEQPTWFQKLVRDHATQLKAAEQKKQKIKEIELDIERATAYFDKARAQYDNSIREWHDRFYKLSDLRKQKKELENE